MSEAPDQRPDEEEPETVSAGGRTVVDRPARRTDHPGPAPAPAPEGTPDDPEAEIETSAHGASPGGTSSMAGKTGATTGATVASPLEALAHAEVLRTRNFAGVCLLIAVAGASAVLFLPGRPETSVPFLCAIGLACVALIYLIHRTHSPATFHDGPGVAIGWYVPALAVAAAVPYFGPYSPVPILLVLGIYVIGMGSSFRVAFAIYLTTAAVQGITGSLAIFGWADPGFIKAVYLAPEIQILCQVLVQLVLFASFIIARSSRRSSLIALGELERAVRAVAQREALLEEAREELRRAVGSGRGRFTDQTIGNYRLGDLIGRGAMGEVYEAVDPRANQAVAVKMLSQASLGNAHHVQRFMRELQTAATIASPNVVRVLEVGEHPLPHLVMERLRGRELSTILRDRRPMSHERVIDLVRQVGAGITAAGAAGVIHRDLKPQNLFLAGATWKILDFGVSRLADSGDTLTAGHIVGTPAYMAPEQARGGEVDHRTDLYALAAIVYRTLTGAAPFAGGEVAEVLYRVVHTAPRRPSSIVTLPEDVDLALAIGLAKASADRFATAAELADAIAAALVGTLDEAVRARGRALVGKGAWAAAPIRPRLPNPGR